jgi:putative Holliday junction resolvase
VVDQAAAVLILQTALDTERGGGRVPGELVEVPESGSDGSRGDG